MVLIGPPRIWENLLTDIRMREDDADRVKRACSAASSRWAEEAEAVRMAGTAPVPAPAGAHRHRATPRVRAPPRPGGPASDPVRLQRRRRARSRDPALLSGHRRQPEADLRDHRGGRPGVRAAGRPGAVRLGRPAPPRHRGQLHRGRRDPAAQPGHLQRLLPQPRGHGAGADRRSPPHGRRGVHRPRRAPRGHRPGGRPRPALRRHVVRAAVHREQAQVQLVHQGGRRARQPAAHVAALINIDGASVGRWAERREIRTRATSTCACDRRCTS